MQKTQDFFNNNMGKYRSFFSPDSFSRLDNGDDGLFDSHKCTFFRKSSFWNIHPGSALSFHL
jgi:hypothetical protein